MQRVIWTALKFFNQFDLMEAVTCNSFADGLTLEGTAHIDPLTQRAL